LLKLKQYILTDTIFDDWRDQRFPETFFQVLWFEGQAVRSLRISMSPKK
jgi:hypothetical protein